MLPSGRSLAAAMASWEQHGSINIIEKHMVEHEEGIYLSETFKSKMEFRRKDFGRKRRNIGTKTA